MKSFHEGKLGLDFQQNLQVIQYDRSNFFRNNVEKLQGTKAVDFLALSRDDLFIIEITDFRGHGVECREKIRKGDLVVEVTQKVRDTISGLCGAYRSGNFELESFSAGLFLKDGPSVTFILILEEDRHPAPSKSFKQMRSNLNLAIARQLKFLNIRCCVHSRKDLPSHFGWSVA